MAVDYRSMKRGENKKQKKEKEKKEAMSATFRELITSNIMKALLQKCDKNKKVTSKRKKL